MISNVRMISLYTLGGLIFCGLVLWIIDFGTIKNNFKRKWFLLAPPILYFVLNLISLLLQKGNIKLIETHLMLIMVPLFIFPILIHEIMRERFEELLKLFLAGLLFVSIFLLVRIVVIFVLALPEDQSIIEYFKIHNTEYVSLSFSILEHPSYLSLKLVFAIIVLFSFSDSWRIRTGLKWSLYLIFTITIFLLASKAGIIALIITSIGLGVANWRKRSHNPFVYFIAISLLIFLTIFSVRRFERITYFYNIINISLDQKDFNWKNMDQRTRNWYAAITLIKDKPLAGNGIVKTRERMVNVYRINGFDEEAKLAMNAHNQFLETQMTFGIAGTLSLLWLLLTPFYSRHHLIFGKLAVPFVLLFSFFLLFESMLNRQWGIMFFMLFYFIIILSPMIKEDTTF